MDLCVVGPVEVDDRPDEWPGSLPDLFGGLGCEPSLGSRAPAGIVVRGFVGGKATLRDGNVVVAGDLDNGFDSLDEVLAIGFGEAIMPGGVQRRLVWPRLDAERVESLGIGVEIRAEGRFVIPVVVEADQVEPGDEFEVGGVGVPRGVGIVDRRAADRDRKPAEKRLHVCMRWVGKPVRGELFSSPRYWLLLVVRIQNPPALPGVCC